MEVSIDGGLTWQESSEVRVIYDGIPFDYYGEYLEVCLHVNCTDEGIIQDVYRSTGAFTGLTYSQTAAEIVDELNDQTTEMVNHE